MNKLSRGWETIMSNDLIRRLWWLVFVVCSIAACAGTQEAVGLKDTGRIATSPLPGVTDSARPKDAVEPVESPADGGHTGTENTAAPSQDTVDKKIIDAENAAVPQKDSASTETTDASSFTITASTPAKKIDSADIVPPEPPQKNDLQADSKAVPGIVLNKMETTSLGTCIAGCQSIYSSETPVPVMPRASVPKPVVPSQPVTPPKAPRQVASVYPAPSLPRALSAQPVICPPLSNTTHRVVNGETLADVALLYYKDKTRWVDIYEANRDRIDKGSLEAGQILIIP